MKVIELLTKIANGEEVPTIIKYKHNIWAYRNDVQDYTDETQFFFGEYIFQEDTQKELNYEVEIIEDKPFNERVEEIYNRHIDYIYGKEDKKIEKLDIYNCFEQLGDSLLAKERLDYNFNAISDKINEIIDYINKEK